MTKLHINAIIGLVIMGCIAVGMTYVLIQNELQVEEFQLIAAILAADVYGVVAVVKHFAGLPVKCPSCGNGSL